MKVQVDGRRRRRLQAMRRVQDAALTLFEARGYEAVTVEEVARAAEVGVASVFRNFKTKEQLVRWDEYDPLLFAELSARLGKRPVLEAVCEAACAALEGFYAADKKRLLRRTDLVAKTPALAAGTGAELAKLRQGLEAALVRQLPNRFRRQVAAAAMVGALEVAVDTWRAERARRSISVLLRAAFSQLARLR
jgi:AcrR family transcriptional regulator